MKINHFTPKQIAGWTAFGRHYIRDMVYAANDGIVTTFAVVAGVRGAELSAGVILVLGFANLAADGLSMAVGNYLGIKSERATVLGDAYEEWTETIDAARHGVVTWIAFVTAGLMPLIPFFGSLRVHHAFWFSLGLTAMALFAVGAGRSIITRRSASRGGLEMLVVGALAGSAAFLAGWLMERFIAKG